MFILTIKVNKESGKLPGLYWAETSLNLKLAALGTVQERKWCGLLAGFIFYFFLLTQIWDTHLLGSHQLSTSCVPVCPGKQAAGSHTLSEVAFSRWEDSKQTQPRVKCFPEEMHRLTWKHVGSYRLMVRSDMKAEICMIRKRKSCQLEKRHPLAGARLCIGPYGGAECGLGRNEGSWAESEVNGGQRTRPSPKRIGQCIPWAISSNGESQCRGSWSVVIQWVLLSDHAASL